MSKRFAMKRFLGMSPEEIAENERMWREENKDISDAANTASSELRDVGITPTGIQDGMPPEAPPEGEEGMEPGAAAGAAPPAAGAPTPSGTPAPTPMA